MIEASQNRWFIKGFRRYVRRYLAKHFFRFHFKAENFPLDLDEPLPVVVIINHSSWWDVLTAYYLANEVFSFKSYAVMDEPQLKRYRFFSQVGFYSVDRESGLKGIREFLSYSQKILSEPGTAVWICPQGDFVSNDARPVRFFPGTAHLVKHLKKCWVLPVALDYELCQEPLPEAFALAGSAVKFDSKENKNVEEINRRLEEELSKRMDQLKELTQKRDFSGFQTLISGKKGIHKLYDLITAIRFWFTGKKFHASHGDYSETKKFS